MKQIKHRWPALTAPLLGGISCFALALVFAPQVQAQAASSSAEFNIPYGKSYNDFNQPYSAGTRDANGNRTIINGLIQTGNTSTLSSSLGGGFFTGAGVSSGGFLGGNGSTGGLASAGAVGNQLNVVTIGSFNTVIVDSTQINNGNQTVNLNGNISSSTLGAAGETLRQDGDFRLALPQPGASPVKPDQELNGDLSLDE